MMIEGAEVRCANWPHALPYSAAAFMLALHDARKGFADVIVSHAEGKALLFKGPSAHRYRVIKVAFDPHDKIVRSATHAVQPDHDGGVPKGLRKFLDSSFSGLTWSADEAQQLAAQYVGCGEPSFHYKWISE